MSLFDVYLAVDWSARSVASPKTPVRDALWVGERLACGIDDDAMAGETYWRTRHECAAYLRERLLYHAAAARRVLIGFDFGFCYPAGFTDALGLAGDKPPWRRIWDMLADMIVDAADNANNRFAVAAELNARCGRAIPGPLWGCPVNLRLPHLPPTSPVYPYAVRPGLALQRMRLMDRRERGLQPAWKLYGTASVGSQILTGIPYVRQLRDDPALAAICRVWPFETGFTPTSAPEQGPFVLLVEIWPGIVARLLDPAIAIRDQAQVRAVAQWFADLDAAGQFGALFALPMNLSPEDVEVCVQEEGWIVGGGIREAISM
jgi:precorrin-8X/cobalt-precorrin-8 methylmutase